MDNLTLAQSQEIWDMKETLTKWSVEEVFACFRMTSILDGKPYNIDTSIDNIDCSGSTSMGELEQLIVTFLQTQEYKGTVEIITVENLMD